AAQATRRSGRNRRTAPHHPRLAAAQTQEKSVGGRRRIDRAWFGGNAFPSLRFQPTASAQPEDGIRIDAFRSDEGSAEFTQYHRHPDAIARRGGCVAEETLRTAGSGAGADAQELHSKRSAGKTRADPGYADAARSDDQSVHHRAPALGRRQCGGVEEGGGGFAAGGG